MKISFNSDSKACTVYVILTKQNTFSYRLHGCKYAPIVFYIKMVTFSEKPFIVMMIQSKQTIQIFKTYLFKVQMMNPLRFLSIGTFSIRGYVNIAKNNAKLHHWHMQMTPIFEGLKSRQRGLPHTSFKYS